MGGALLPWPGFVAGGTIVPACFVKLTTADYTVVAAGAGDDIFSVSYNATLKAPGISGSDDDVAATTGRQINLYAWGQVVPVRCAGTINRGAWVQSDANGNAVTVNTASGRRPCGGIAVTLGAASQIVYIMLMPTTITYP